MTTTLILAQATQVDSGDAVSIGLVILLAVVAIAALVLFIAALVSVLSSTVLSGVGKIVWILLIFVFPLLGPLLWFFLGRNVRI
ncbi:PLDc N-terminal domain-containing protein [Hoyosella sp. G463]|uniref:PLDc N-terminal domain-containing protein n=1 Tax=Lolliginicoccus lacisalsi TaxID=2742202 RepID=A0A927JCB7_9ACTN|nr:PLDc N-terminal domain-containing protein [Lolliginicoccus lacisalsi]MBD8506027.1 PLDc N-terminal domain-containing protein [Lolliginicoccus lacisalsi]